MTNLLMRNLANQNIHDRNRQENCNCSQQHLALHSTPAHIHYEMTGLTKIPINLINLQTKQN